MSLTQNYGFWSYLSFKKYYNKLPDQLDFINNSTLTQLNEVNFKSYLITDDKNHSGIIEYIGSLCGSQIQDVKKNYDLPDFKKLLLLDFENWLINKNDFTIEENDYFVYEAIQPVKKTKLDKWIARGKDGHYVIKRLKKSDQILTNETLGKMKEIGSKFEGKNYDLTFEWSDDKMYCSELIWKIYKRATGIEVGKLQKLKDFDLSNEAVKNIMKKRYGNNIPENEIVISPASIFESENLKTVKSN